MSLGDTDPSKDPSARQPGVPVRTKATLVVRFAGDVGRRRATRRHQFASSDRGRGRRPADAAEFHAEIRAPRGQTFGVSAYQVQFGPGEVLTPGDEADVLVASIRGLHHQHPVP